MKSNPKRAIYLMLVAVIVFSATMAIPAIHNSRWKDTLQGGSLGLMMGGIISLIPQILLRLKK